MVLLALVGWSAFTSAAFIDSAMDGRTAENRLQATQEAYEIKLAALRDQQRLLEEELNRSNSRADVINGELSIKQQALVDTATKLRMAEAELDGLRDNIEALLAERRGERDQINALNEEVISLRIALAEAERSDIELSDTLHAFSATMTDVIAARDRAAARASDLDIEVASLEAEIAAWQHRQETLLAQLEHATHTSLAELDGLFVGADVDLQSILDQTRRDYTGRGGGPAAEGPDEGERQGFMSPVEEDTRVASLATDMERMALMRVAIDRMPFGVPTHGTRMTSGFGPRRDPFHRGVRMHNGMDFAGPVGTPIYSTGEGVVTFSGRMRGYGIIVKIRHAFGFETVYAHLSKSRVTVGQRVARGDRIADMGSTGRSTGSHLHYEIRIDGKPINPARFIKAARNVL